MSEDEAETLLESKLEQSDADSRQLALALDCIPLAITQAAAYIRERRPRCSVRQYREEVEHSRKSRTGLLRRDVSLPGRDVEAINSVLLTWRISFEHIYKTRKSAANLLSLMSFCDRLAIPECLVRSDADSTDDADCIESVNEKPDFEEDIVALCSFSFVSQTADPQSWEMHGLVQDATQAWLEDHGRLSNVQERFVHRLYTSFPTGEFENWPACSRLFSHAKSAMEQKPVGESAVLEWASVMYNSALYARGRGNFPNALAMATASTEARFAHLGKENESTLKSLAIVASVYLDQGQWDKAEELFLKVIETKRRVLGEEHPNTLTSMNNLASTYYNQGRWDKAEELFLKVIEKSRRVVGEEHPGTLTSMNNLASTYRNQGRWKKAEELGVRVMKTLRRVLGEEHPDTLTSMANLALTYYKQGRWEKAEELFVTVIETRRRVVGEEHPDTLTSIANLALTYSDQGWWKKGEELGERVIETMRRVLGEEHPNTLMSMNNLASMHYKQGRWEKVEKLLTKALETGRRVLGEEHPNTLASMNTLALTYYNQKRWAEAEQLQMQVVAGYKKAFGLRHPYALTLTEDLAHIQRTRDDALASVPEKDVPNTSL